MNRQKLLLLVLALLAILGLPYTYLDRLLLDSRNAVAVAAAEFAPMRAQLSQMREREQKLNQHRKSMDALQSRLITDQPFASIQGEVAALAKQAGVTLGAMSLEGPLKVEEMPGIVRYQATVQVSGTRTQFVDFLALLERSRLLIEIPEIAIKLALPPGGLITSPLPGQAATNKPATPTNGTAQSQAKPATPSTTQPAIQPDVKESLILSFFGIAPKK